MALRRYQHDARVRKLAKRLGLNPRELSVRLGPRAPVMRSWRNRQTQRSQTPPPHRRPGSWPGERTTSCPAEGNPAYLADSESVASAFESQAGHHRRQAHTDERRLDKAEVASANLAPATTFPSGASSNGRAAVLHTADECSTHSAPTSVRKHMKMCAPLITGR